MDAATLSSFELDSAALITVDFSQITKALVVIARQQAEQDAKLAALDAKVTQSVSDINVALAGLQQAASARDGRLEALEASLKAASEPPAQVVMQQSMKELQLRVKAAQVSVASSSATVGEFKREVDEASSKSGSDLAWCLSALQRMEATVLPQLRQLEAMQEDLRLRLEALQALSAAHPTLAVSEADMKVVAEDVHHVVDAATQCLDEGTQGKGVLMEKLGGWADSRGEAVGAMQATIHAMETQIHNLQCQTAAPAPASTGDTTVVVAAPAPAPVFTASHGGPCATAESVAAIDARVAALEAASARLADQIDVAKKELAQLASELSTASLRFGSKDVQGALGEDVSRLERELIALQEAVKALRSASVPTTEFVTSTDPTTNDALSKLQSRMAQQGQQISSLFDRLQAGLGASEPDDGRVDKALGAIHRDMDSTAQRLADMLRQQAALQASLAEKASRDEVRDLNAAVSDKVDASWVKTQVEPKVDKDAIEKLLSQYMASVDRNLAGTRDDILDQTNSSVSDLRRKFALQLRKALEAALAGGGSMSISTSFGRRPVTCIACDRPVPQMLDEGVPVPLQTQLPPGRPVSVAASVVELDHVRGGGFRVPSRSGSRPSTPDESTVTFVRPAGRQPYANPATGHHWEYVHDAPASHAGYSPGSNATPHAPTHSLPLSARGPSVNSARGTPSRLSSMTTSTMRPARASSAGTSRGESSRRKHTDVGRWKTATEGPKVVTTPSSVYTSFVSSHSHSSHVVKD